jgi:hypothetical protein
MHGGMRGGRRGGRGSAEARDAGAEVSIGAEAGEARGGRAIRTRRSGTCYVLVLQYTDSKARHRK